jgi:hemerythrin-like domain-containing protein
MSQVPWAPVPPEPEEKERELTPAEDLMREHGVLRRVMLVYDEAILRLQTRKELPRDVIPGCARIVRRFVEEYHEKIEEEFVFPRFEQAGKLPELIAILRRQHEAGRRVTDEVLRLGAGKGGAAERKRLAASLRAFNRMYGPHAAREDTILLPAFREVAGKDYEALGERFEQEERRRVGEHGFERAVEEVGAIERAMQMDDLAKLTPAPSPSKR